MPVICLVSTHFCFLECPGITAAIELRFVSCMHLSCLPGAGVGISWVWKPRATAALMVQIEFPCCLAGCFPALHYIRVMFLRSLYYHIQNSTYHRIQLCTVFTVNIDFFICNTMIVSPVFVSEDAVCQTHYWGQEVVASGMPWSGILGPVHLLYMQ